MDKLMRVVGLLFYAILIGSFICIFMSLRTLFLPGRIKGKLVSLENFLCLGMIYLTVLVGFGVVYILFGLFAEPVLAEQHLANGSGILKEAETSIYFSAMTLFSVGHGDVVPLGLGRWIAILEAFIGYTIPAAFVARAVMDRE